ncbi:Uncharacterised protein [Mycobacteroides abscessus subsp. abscessus]|nr:Uncharacterised protein [Mycobacteroides abscessus subsp. abscessus]
MCAIGASARKPGEHRSVNLPSHASAVDLIDDVAQLQSCLNLVAP